MHWCVLCNRVVLPRLCHSSQFSHYFFVWPLISTSLLLRRHWMRAMTTCSGAMTVAAAFALVAQKAWLKSHSVAAGRHSLQVVATEIQKNCNFKIAGCLNFKLKAKTIDVKEEMVDVKEMSVRVWVGECSLFCSHRPFFVLFCDVQLLLVFSVCVHGLFTLQFCFEWFYVEVRTVFMSIVI